MTDGIHPVGIKLLHLLVTRFEDLPMWIFLQTAQAAGWEGVEASISCIWVVGVGA